MMIKRTNKYRGKLVALAMVAACALPVAAQTTQPGSTTGAAGSRTSTMTTDRDNDNNWGWIGLLGLAGLAGLMRKKDTHDVDHRTTATGAVR
ncbi:MAG: WGxxGxxG family protein [Burkholderiaceae bacterium]